MATHLPYERAHLSGIVELCRAEGWPSYPADPERAHRAMTAPGVTALVAVEGSEVVGFACWQSDGEMQAHLSLLAVEAGHRRRGIGRALVTESLMRSGAERMDLVTDSAEVFYLSLAHRRMAGFRLYPPGRIPPSAAPDPVVQAAGAEDGAWVSEVITDRWGAPTVISRGRTHDAGVLPALIAYVGGERVGLATYRIEGAEVELVTLDAFVQDRGIGTALLRAVVQQAEALGCRHLWLVTGNDNLDAVRFYQRRGMRLVEVHRGAVDAAREQKPEIPRVGDYAIPVHDEVELELDLADRRS